MKPGTVESGAACRAHILELLVKKNMSGADLAPIVGRKIPTVLGYLRDLRANDKVHIAARCGHNLNIKLYAFGPGQDASNLAQRVLAALQERPMTSKELCQALDESPVTVRKTCEHLRWGEDKSVYVADWTRPESAYNRAVHVYAVGNLPDKPKPRPLTRKQTSARARKKRRAKLKADPVLYVNHLMIKRRSYARTKTSVAKPDAFMAQFAGLFGNRSHQEAA